MTWPSVTIEQYNTFSSSPDGVENTLLFVGNAQNNKGKVLPVNANSDLDELLGTNASPLKNFLQSALTNAGQNAFSMLPFCRKPAKAKKQRQPVRHGRTPFWRLRKLFQLKAW